MPNPDTRDFEARYYSCFLDFGVKTVAGLLIGSMMGSFFLHGYKKWPMYLGGGLGVGMAYKNCENSLNNFLLSMDPKTCVINDYVWSMVKTLVPFIDAAGNFLHLCAYRKQP